MIRVENGRNDLCRCRKQQVRKHVSLKVGAACHVSVTYAISELSPEISPIVPLCYPHENFMLQCIFIVRSIVLRDHDFTGQERK